MINGFLAGSTLDSLDWKPFYADSDVSRKHTASVETKYDGKSQQEVKIGGQVHTL